jgi:hypothetical protein
MKKWIILGSFAALAFVVLALTSRPAEAPEPVERAVVAPPRALVPAPVESAPVDVAMLETALLGKQEEVVEPVVEAPKPRRARRPVIDDEPVDEEPVDLGLTDYDFQSTVGSWDGVKGCLATESERGEDRRRGALQVSFTIRADGAVLESKVIGASNEEAEELVPCVERKAKRIRFPAFAGTDVTRTAKFVF